MRRAWSVLLLALFSVSLIAPLLAPDPDSKLPPCCRRSGKHHCSLGADGAASGPALQSAACVDFPGLRAVPVNPSTGLVAIAEASSRALHSSPAARMQRQPLVQLAMSRVEPERGPPSSLY